MELVEASRFDTVTDGVFKSGNNGSPFISWYSLLTSLNLYSGKFKMSNSPTNRSNLAADSAFNVSISCCIFVISSKMLNGFSSESHSTTS